MSQRTDRESKSLEFCFHPNNAIMYVSEGQEDDEQDNQGEELRRNSEREKRQRHMQERKTEIEKTMRTANTCENSGWRRRHGKAQGKQNWQSCTNSCISGSGCLPFSLSHHSSICTSLFWAGFCVWLLLTSPGFNPNISLISFAKRGKLTGTEPRPSATAAKQRVCASTPTSSCQLKQDTGTDMETHTAQDKTQRNAR